VVSLEDAKRGKLPHEDFEFLASIVKKQTQEGESNEVVVMKSCA
jgi:hypothetical protein